MSQLLVKTVADFSTTLTAKTAVGATTATLTSGLDSEGVQLPTGTYGFTIDRNNSQKEHFTATLTGANLTAIKTVTVGTGVGTSGLVKTHRKGSEVIITDHVALKRMMNVLDGTTSFDSATPLGYDGAPSITTGNQFATKTYADGIAIAGGADASTTTKGITKMSVAPASATSPISVGDNDGRVPTQGENDALVGTSGTPSSTNKYITEDDVSAAAVSGKVVRATGTALPALSGASLTSLPKQAITTQVFTSSGTWTKPTGVTKAFVRLIGGGGAGGGCTSGGARIAGGGGAGGYAEALVTVSGNVTVTVGTGGAGVSGNSGASGNNSVFAGDTTITAIGGTGAAQSGGTSGAGGAGGGTTNADFGISGQAGYEAQYIKANYSGSGGDSVFGYGGRQVAGDTAGSAGVGYGSGGSGSVTSSAVQTGGNGTDGIVIVEWVV